MSIICNVAQLHLCGRAGRRTYVCTILALNDVISVALDPKLKLGSFAAKQVSIGTPQHSPADGGGNAGGETILALDRKVFLLRK